MAQKNDLGYSTVTQCELSPDHRLTTYQIKVDALGLTKKFTLKLFVDFLEAEKYIRGFLNVITYFPRSGDKSIEWATDYFSKNYLWNGLICS